MIGAFARSVGADLSEAAHPLREFDSISAFFSRPLRSGARTWPRDPATLTSPVDGIVGALGTVRRGEVLQAKGLPYRIDDLLGEPGAGRAFEGGAYLTLYLSPRHYHRIHAPAGGRILRGRALPGALLPVNEPALRSVPRLFPRNERLAMWMRTEGGREVGVVAVGAYNVGRISAAFDPDWNGPGGKGVTNRKRRREVEARRYDPPLPVDRGEEIMAFHLGSTVVLLVAPPLPLFAEEVRPGREIRVGDPLFGVSAPGGEASPGAGGIRGREAAAGRDGGTSSVSSPSTRSGSEPGSGRR